MKYPNARPLIEQRMCRMEFAPKKNDDFQDGQTYRQACEALAKSLMKSLPTSPVSFEIQLSYAYGIGLHAVVDVANLDTAAIERTFARFRALDERSWFAG